MVGDRLHDIEGAKECGIASLGVRFGYAKENELEEAVYYESISQCDCVVNSNKHFSSSKFCQHIDSI